ncbi:hypothetical protein OD91_0866 [Lutibacter sp. Hel_I_33_5]|uniref:hypothetical protein n=1 Tax=Lutibacter sp. Hel_I_33_5 TaxID=1566289 RepID=UPI0011A8F851|nr:hypothetical protein [Lutibacter sp. Hel_I_33_5]TVZ55611.1 hypothetical protein OD91_0866 [Lutibacter sp. Hel_I_33_5]
MKNQPFFTWLDDAELRNQLQKSVVNSKGKRFETQKDVSKTLEISLTKIKEIENGSCKDFNAINNYINYFNEPIIQ